MLDNDEKRCYSPREDAAWRKWERAVVYGLVVLLVVMFITGLTGGR